MSECLGICEIDYESGYCLGCGRSVDEIYGSEEDEPAPESGADASATPTDRAPSESGTPGTE